MAPGAPNYLPGGVQGPGTQLATDRKARKSPVFKAKIEKPYVFQGNILSQACMTLQKFQKIWW